LKAITADELLKIFFVYYTYPEKQFIHTGSNENN